MATPRRWRRERLLRSAAAEAALDTLVTRSSSPVPQSSRQEVVVVGAGIAGLDPPLGAPPAFVLKTQRALGKLISPPVSAELFSQQHLNHIATVKTLALSPIESEREVLRERMRVEIEKVRARRIKHLSLHEK